MNSIAISACQISASIGNRLILQGIDLQLPAGRWTSIVGPNGAGKSTLLKVLAGLLPGASVQGEVQLLGRPLARIPARERARQLAWLGQNEGSADDLSSYDVAMLGRLPHQAWLASPSAADHAAVEQALRTTQAWDWRHRPLSQLSGGERQRVLLARALAVQAQVLLMDEPLANLDPPHQTDWLHTMRALVDAGGTVVSVLHEVSLALQADDMVVMAAGRVLHQGAVAYPAHQQPGRVPAAAQPARRAALCGPARRPTARVPTGSSCPAPNTPAATWPGCAPRAWTGGGRPCGARRRGAGHLRRPADAGRGADRPAWHRWQRAGPGAAAAGHRICPRQDRAAHHARALAPWPACGRRTAGCGGGRATKSTTARRPSTRPWPPRATWPAKPCPGWPGPTPPATCWAATCTACLKARRCWATVRHPGAYAGQRV
jgi:iron complex transport system ATP-binding protein